MTSSDSESTPSLARASWGEIDFGDLGTLRVAKTLDGRRWIAERPAFKLLHGRHPNQRVYETREGILENLEKSNEIKAAPKITEIPLFLASEMTMSLIDNDVFGSADFQIDLHDVKAGRTIRMWSEHVFSEAVHAWEIAGRTNQLTPRQHRTFERAVQINSALRRTSLAVLIDQQIGADYDPQKTFLEILVLSEPTKWSRMFGDNFYTAREAVDSKPQGFYKKHGAQVVISDIYRRFGGNVYSALRGARGEDRKNKLHQYVEPDIGKLILSSHIQLVTTVAERHPGDRKGYYEELDQKAPIIRPSPKKA